MQKVLRGSPLPPMQNKKVIYTAIFGDKDILIDPIYRPEGFDFVCFTDSKVFRSSVWQIRNVEPKYEDPVRNARYYKIMAHKVLPEYEQSIWIDGNMVVQGDCNELVDKYLKEKAFATYEHSQQKRRLFKLFWIRDRSFGRDCIYDEAQDLISKNSRGFYMDSTNIIEEQMNRYKEAKYPSHQGLAVTMVILRNHNNTDVIKSMEDWWKEICNGSRRDQLSFNYVAWKNKFPFVYIKGDPRFNRYFVKNKHKTKINFK